MLPKWIFLNTTGFVVDIYTGSPIGAIVPLLRFYNTLHIRKLQRLLFGFFIWAFSLLHFICFIRAEWGILR